MGFWIIYEAITTISLALTCLLVVIIMQIHPKIKNIPSINFAKVLFFSYFLFKIIDISSILFKNEFLSRFSGVLLYIFLFVLVISVNYFTKESFLSIGFCVICSMGLLVIYVSTQSDVVQLITRLGYQRVEWRGLFNILCTLCNSLAIFYLFYWGLKTYINTPYALKKEALLFFTGIIFDTFITIFFYGLFILNPIFMNFINISLIIGSIIILYSIIREPKLLYILPFEVYRISIRNHEGYPLFNHNWYDSNISEKIFTGFLNSIEIMSEEIMNIGGILDINLNKGILILYHSENITTGLITSKASKLLRECVLTFSNGFEKKFKRLLKKNCIDMNEYKSAYELIEKYFPRIPYRILRDEKRKYTLSSKYIILPKQIENKIKNMFTSEVQYDSVINDLARSPISLSSVFFDLYNEIRDNMELDDEPVKVIRKISSPADNNLLKQDTLMVITSKQKLSLEEKDVQRVIIVAQEIIKKHKILKMKNLYNKSIKITDIPRKQLLRIIQFLADQKVIVDGSNYTRRTIMENEYRRKIYNVILENNGANFSLIKKEVFINKPSTGGQLIWHLGMLIKFGIIKKIKIGKSSLFLPIEMDIDLGKLYFFMKDNLNKKIIELFTYQEMIKKSDLYKLITESRSKVNYRIKNLIENNIIRFKNKEKKDICLLPQFEREIQKENTRN
ncbi:MAG: hypothetical protein KGD63_11300 [Candidatus Lokiarchaeota archaeon]|nr:hypothetical protein [Candidatus Lokiarchaeota archaeon]